MDMKDFINGMNAYLYWEGDHFMFVPQYLVKDAEYFLDQAMDGAFVKSYYVAPKNYVSSGKSGGGSPDVRNVRIYVEMTELGKSAWVFNEL